MEGSLFQGLTLSAMQRSVAATFEEFGPLPTPVGPHIIIRNTNYGRIVGFAHRLLDLALEPFNILARDELTFEPRRCWHHYILRHHTPQNTRLPTFRRVGRRFPPLVKDHDNAHLPEPLPTV
jgi:hypothetical protein